MEDKNGLYVLAIVGIIAIVGVIVLATSGSRMGIGTTQLTSSEDAAGQAFAKTTRTGYCGDGVRNVAEQCDGRDLGGLTCQSLGNFNSGTLSCNSRCQLVTTKCKFETVPQIKSLYMYINGNKNYWLDTGTVAYYFTTYTRMTTDVAVDSLISTSCYEENEQKWKYVNADGMTIMYPWSGEYSLSASMGLEQQTFDGVSGTCQANGCIFYNNRTEFNCSFSSIQYNVNSNKYPNINGVTVLKNTVTNQYFIYINASNYNGGICYMSYDVSWGTGSDYWNMNLQNCPTQVSYLALIDTNSTQNITDIFVNVYLQPKEYSISTSGYGRFQFGGYAKPVVIQGKSLVPATKVVIQKSKETKTTVSELVKQEFQKKAFGQPINEQKLKLVS